ncbi:hypothetical protein B296_00005687, partial [Ensete ventricosum]
LLNRHNHPHPSASLSHLEPFPASLPSSSHSHSALATLAERMSSVTRAGLDHKLAMAKRCAHEGVMAGAKAAVVASVAAAIPTLASVRMLPWARANLNPTAQALIISTGCRHTSCASIH